MVTMLTHRMMDNLSCMLLAKDELQAHMQAQAAAQGMEAQKEKIEDSELVKENARLRMQLLEAAADNDAISRSLQERVASLADITDAKFQAESEAKILQVQIKSMQKDMDAHKYELHLLRKQLQIRNDEREHNKKVSDASNKQHLDNVKKIAQLESECQRLRGLIRQRLPGPAVVAQMRAECEMHIIKTGKKKSQCMSTQSRPTLPNSSYLHHQREREALTERLLSVEEEAKFLKEALANRTAELQEARQLCARTAVKLSSAQDLVEEMSMNASTPSTPMRPQRNAHLVARNNASMQGTCSHVEQDNMYVSSTLQRKKMMSIDHEEVGSCNTDELSCAESWASALFAELSHLSNSHEDDCVGNESICNPKDKEKHGTFGNTIGSANGCYKPDASIPIQELDLYSALHQVNQKLSHVGEGILLSSLTSNDDTNVGNAGFHAHPSDNIVVEMDQNFSILDEISHIKHLLLELGRVMEMQGKLHGDSVNVVNDDSESINDVISANQEGKTSRERPLSRFHDQNDGPESINDVINVMNDGPESIKGVVSANQEGKTSRERPLRKFHNQNGEKLDTQFSDGAKLGSANMEEFGDITIDCSAEGASGNAKFRDIATSLETFSSSLQLNLAAGTIAVAADVDTHALLRASQAELELLRGTIAMLEGEVAHLLQEKADLAQEICDACSLTKTLEAELATSHGNVEALKAEVSSLRSELADQTEKRFRTRDPTPIPQLGGQPFSQGEEFCNVKEEQDLAVARAQLADCQRNIHVMRKQLAPNALHSTLQDVIIEDSSFFDSLSQSSKSTSPNMSQATTLSPKTNDVDPIEHNNISLPQQADMSFCHSSSSSNINNYQERNNPHRHAEDVQSSGNCKLDDVDKDLKCCSLLTKSTNEYSEVKPTLSKPPKSSTTSLIVEFFSKAKLSKK